MNPRRRTIGMTGATGCLGSAFLRSVLAREVDTRVIAIARRPSAARDRFAALPAQQRARIKFIEGDLSDRHSSA